MTLTRFGLGRPTDIGVRGESPGILPSTAIWNRLVQDRVAFGQSLSVNAVQMAAAVNTIANGGERVDPAVVSAPVTTTVVDATGLIIYFAFAILILGI